MKEMVKGYVKDHMNIIKKGVLKEVLSGAGLFLLFGFFCLPEVRNLMNKTQTQQRFYDTYGYPFIFGIIVICLIWIVKDYLFLLLDVIFVKTNTLEQIVDVESVKGFYPDRYVVYYIQDGKNKKLKCFILDHLKENIENGYYMKNQSSQRKQITYLKYSKLVIRVE